MRFILVVVGGLILAHFLGTRVPKALAPYQPDQHSVFAR